MVLVLLRVTQPLPSNGGFSGSPIFALGGITFTDKMKCNTGAVRKYFSFVL
jgi:hypothetical protein